MNLTGIIEEIIFRNEDNGYTVAVILSQQKGFEEYVTVVGKVPDIRVGQEVSLEGEYVSTKYGEQFAFESVQLIYPTTISGIKKYLSSGIIKGVGPAIAGAMVDLFKEDTLAVIEYAPEKLVKVRGISKNKAEKISESFNSLKKMQNCVMFLQTYNITINMAIKIYNIYGDKTIDMVNANPYRLVEDVDGIGFLTADKIAKSMGIASNSLFRIRAGIMHILNESAEKNGNTYVKRDVLFNNIENLLGLSEGTYTEKFFEVIDNMGFDKVVCCFKNSEGEEIVMLSRFYYIENIVGQKLALLNILSKQSNIDVSNEIDMFEKINNFTFDIDQRRAIESSIKNGVSVITGGPGTGKTTIIKCILNILEQLGNKVMLLAPTGRASKRLSESTNREAKTIHRGLEFNFRGDKKSFVYNENNPLNVSAVIVDEVSMVDVTLMSALLKALPRDCKLILVGDKDQLPSVGAGNVLDDILKSGIINVSYLNKIFRQDEKSLIISNAHLINNGEMPILNNSSKDFFFELKEDPEEIKNTVVDLVTRRLPSFTSVEANKIQVLAPLKAGASGIENINNELQDKINPNMYGKAELIVGKTIFREGDKVMQTTNNYDLVWTKNNGMFEEEGAGVFNGDIGFIKKINLGSGETEVLFDDGRLCVYPRTELSDLSLAYAITIHKSQGSEFDFVVIPIVNGPSLIFTKNLIYTAVTRAKKMVVIIGSKKSLRRMVGNSLIINRNTMLKQFLIEAHEKLKLMYNE